MSKQELIRVVLEDCSFERTEESKNYAPTGMALNIDRHFTVNLVEGRSTDRKVLLRGVHAVDRFVYLFHLFICGYRQH